MDDNSGLTPPDPDGEGVRIIGADEAAEAVERGDVASRRGQDQPKFGDRPPRAESQPKGPRPTLRFPLPDSEVADVARPKVKPPAPPPHEDRSRSLFSVAPDPGPDAAHPDEDPVEDDMGDETDDRRDEVEPEGDDWTVEGPAPTDDDTGGVRIPHWTEPATGEVPAVLIGDREEGDEDAWAAFAESAPRWRDDSRDYDDRDDLSVLADDEARVGALDPDAPGEHELLTFEDLDAPPPRKKKAPAKKKKKKAPAAAGGPTGSGRPPGAAPASGSRPSGRPPQRTRVGGPPPAGGRTRPIGAPPGGGQGGDRDVPTAVAVGAVLALAALLLLWLGPGWMMILVSAIVLLAAAEFFTTTRRAGYVPAQLLGIAVCVALPLATFWKGTLAFPVVLGLTAMCGFLWYIVGAGDERPVMNFGVTAMGILWIGVLASFAGLLLAVPDQGPSLLLSVLLVAVAQDVGGFFIGRAMGRAPLTAISPGKTIEGLVGGIAAAVVVSLLVVLTLGIGPFGESLGRALVMGLVVGAATAVGDLCESVVKRDLGVKDMGNILPGHGGVLDRMDGILFALPVAWYLGLYLGVVGV